MPKTFTTFYEITAMSDANLSVLFPNEYSRVQAYAAQSDEALDQAYTESSKYEDLSMLPVIIFFVGIFLASCIANAAHEIHLVVFCVFLLLVTLPMCIYLGRCAATHTKHKNDLAPLSVLGVELCQEVVTLAAASASAKQWRDGVAMSRQLRSVDLQIMRELEVKDRLNLACKEAHGLTTA